MGKVRAILREPGIRAGELVRLYNHRSAPAVREAFGEMLREWPWSWYMTWTFRDRVGPVKVAQEVRQHLRLIEWGQGYRIGWLFGLEQEHGADRPHAHGLICGEREDGSQVLMEPYWRAWQDRMGAGRFVRTMGPLDAVTFYCTKYSVKGGELFMSDNLATFRRRHSAQRSGAPPADVQRESATSRIADTTTRDLWMSRHPTERGSGRMAEKANGPGSLRSPEPLNPTDVSDSAGASARHAHLSTSGGVKSKAFSTSVDTAGCGSGCAAGGKEETATGFEPA